MNTSRENGRSSDWVHAGYALAAGLCALVTFGASYGGHQFLVVGSLGLIIGIGVAYGGTRLQQPYWLVIGEGIVAYFLFGAAIVASSTALAGVFPGPSSISILASMAVRGWAGLLSTAPVVGNTQNLLVVPFLCGVACGLVTTLLALRVRRYPLAAVPPLGLLVVGILFGTSADAERIIPGGLLGVVLLLWIAHTQRVRRQADIGTSSRTRPLLGGGIVLACGLAGVSIAPQLPMASGHVRYVLRDHISPPFNIDRYVSPLSAYRSYVLPSELRNTTLFVATGVPRNTYLQIASMDAYDGVVFNVAEGSAGSSTSGNFATVGQPVSDEPCQSETVCHEAHIMIKVRGYQNVWMPSAGTVRSVSFGGPARTALANAFRYNVSTEGAVVSTGLQPGDTYTLDTDLPTYPSRVKLSHAAVVPTPQPTPIDSPSIVHSIAEKLTAGASTPFAKAQDLATGLADEGAFSDGYGNQASSLAGHGASRLNQFLSLSQPVGDSEQYAAAMTLMARSLNLPARVELGVDVKKGGDIAVKGKDVTAWVDINFQGIGWYPFNPTPPNSAHVNVKNPPPTPSSTNQSQYQPPAHPPTSAQPSSPNATEKGHSKKTSHSAVGSVAALAKLVLLILLVGALLLSPALLILMLKSRRRSRRRGAPTTSAQIAGGWAEILDCANDVGAPVSRMATRREQAGFIGGNAATMAEAANAATFGPNDPRVDEVDWFWKMVDESIRQMHSGLTFWRRMRARLNLASIRPDLAKVLRDPRVLMRP